MSLSLSEIADPAPSLELIAWKLFSGGRTAQTYNIGEMKLVQIKSTKASITAQICRPSILKSHMIQKMIQ